MWAKYILYYSANDIMFEFFKNNFLKQLYPKSILIFKKKNGSDLVS